MANIITSILLFIIILGFSRGVFLAQKKEKGAYGFLLLNFFLLIGYTVFHLYTENRIIDPKYTLLPLYLGTTGSATALLIFVLEYINNKLWLRFPRILLFLLEPMVLTILIYWVSIDKKFSSNIFPSFSPLWATRHLHGLYIILLLILSLLLLASKKTLEGKGLLFFLAFFLAFFIPILSIV